MLNRWWQGRLFDGSMGSNENSKNDSSNYNYRQCIRDVVDCGNTAVTTAGGDCSGNSSGAAETVTVVVVKVEVMNVIRLWRQ